MEASRQSTGKQLTIGELVAKDWRKAEVFKKYNIDFCCGGKRTVSEACHKKGIAPALIEAELARIDARVCDHANFNDWSLDLLVDYIHSKHHRYVANAIPFLGELSVKVTRAHGDDHPELAKIERLTREVSDELKVHMKKEEIFLFPYINKLVDADEGLRKIKSPPFRSIAHTISVLESEHLTTGDAMAQIRELSAGFTPPDDACFSYRAFFAKLHEFQQDMIQHVHLENNILFPRALKLEARLLRV